ncbi:MAG: DUF177 domain-containing protein [Acidimicrobiia bacterium]|nr:DUF177 domain-containing protein [Acidimicrobiia bacterium]MDH3398766.1 DUF177 domain-containing protein [Acidimicrobiia bacterium]
MNSSPFILLVTDLLGRASARRDETIVGPIEIVMDLDRVDASNPVTVQVRLEALADQILARGDIAYSAQVHCNRCLTEWTESGDTAFTQLYSREPNEDTQPITRDGHIDLEPAIHDEVSLALPLVPLCKADCLGLCPTCGTDLNTDSCSGHADESNSPFSALRQLLEP